MWDRHSCLSLAEQIEREEARQECLSHGSAG